MSTVAQKFYLASVDDDQTGGATVKKLAETAPGANSATTNTWTTATVAVRTHIPLAADSTATDTSSTNGWSFNNGGADGIGSTSSANGLIPAGVWGFSVAYSLNTPALLATIACTVTAHVYRVATGGGARTLLFTAASANFSATGTITWNSASQPSYTLAPGEVIQVGITASSAATAATVIGAITNTVLTTNLGANTFITVPAPGVRTLYIQGTADTSAATDAATSVNFFPRATADTAAATDASSRVVTAARSTADTAAATDAVTRANFFPRATTDTALAVDTATRQTVQARATADTATATDAVTRQAIFIRATADAAPATDAVTRAFSGARTSTDSAPAVDTSTRQTIQGRATTDTALATDAVTRQTVQARATADSAPATDASTRAFTGARTVTDTAPATDAVTRTVIHPRSTADSAPATDAATRQTVQARATTDSAPATDVVTRVLIQVRGLAENIGPNATDFPITFGTKVIASTVLNHETGDPVVGATVKLFRQSDDRVVQTTTSGAGGAYSFVRDQFDPNDYYILCYYTILGVQYHGVSDRGVQPAFP